MTLCTRATSVITVDSILTNPFTTRSVWKCMADRFNTTFPAALAAEVLFRMHKDGVNEYTQFFLPIYMPKGKEACKYCPCVKFDNDSNTRRCKFTWELLAYPDSSLGEHCALIRESEL